MILGANPAGQGFVLRDFVLIELFQISHNCVTECMLQTKFLLKTYLKAIRDLKAFFPICRISQYVIFLYNRRGRFKLLDLQGDPPPPQFPLLTVMIFFQSKIFTACKIKDEKEETIFYFFDGVQSTEDYIATHTIRYKFFSVITQLSVKVTVVLLLKIYYIFYWNKRGKF